MRIECPNCKAQYDIEDYETGKTAECACGNKFIIEEMPVKLNVISQKRSKAKALMVAFGCILLATGIFILYHAYDEMQRFGKTSLDSEYTTPAVITFFFGIILIFMPFCRKK